MTELTTDLGTLSLLEGLNDRGKRALQDFMDRCSRWSASVTLERWDFDNPGKLEGVKLEYDVNDRRKGRVVATCDFGNALWRRGSLRIKDIELPQTVMLGIKGRRIGDVVDGAPFPDFTISHAVHDRKQGRTTLRIRCDGETLAPIPRSW